MATRPTINSNKNGLRNLPSFAKMLFSELKGSWDLSFRLFVRDTKSLYREAFLGSFWLFLPAVTAAGSLSLAANAQLINISELNAPYPVYVIVGTILWQLFHDSIKAPLDALEKSKKLLAKLKYPIEASILAQIWQVLFHFAIKLVLILVVFLIYRIQVNSLFLLFPFGCLSILVLGFGIGLVICPFAGLYKDVSTILPHVMSLLMFLTPVFYGENIQGPLKFIVDHNPLTFMIVTSRDFILNGQLEYWTEWISCSLISIPLLLIGWAYTRLSLPIIVERAGN